MEKKHIYLFGFCGHVYLFTGIKNARTGRKI